MNQTLPEGFSVRPSQIEDTPAIVQIMNATSQQERNAPTTTPERQRRWVEMEGVNLSLNTILIENARGTAVAYMYFEQSEPYIVYVANGVVHPDYQNLGLGTFMLQWAETEAAKRMVMAPPEAKVMLWAEIYETNENGRLLLHNLGFHQIRSWIHLKQTMTSPPPKPNLPANIKIKPITESLWPNVLEAMDEAFQDHWGEPDPNQTNLLSEPNPIALFTEAPKADKPNEIDYLYFNTPDLIFAAVVEGDKVIGSCLNNARHIADDSVGVLGSLSVRKAWRKQGVGTALTYHALQAFYEQGIMTVKTDTDKESFTKSYNIYQKAGFEIYAQQDLYEKTIRTGIDTLQR